MILGPYLFNYFFNLSILPDDEVVRCTPMGRKIERLSDLSVIPDERDFRYGPLHQNPVLDHLLSNASFCGNLLLIWVKLRSLHELKSS